MRNTGQAVNARSKPLARVRPGIRVRPAPDAAIPVVERRLRGVSAAFEQQPEPRLPIGRRALSNKTIEELAGFAPVNSFVFRGAASAAGRSAHQPCAPQSSLLSAEDQGEVALKVPRSTERLCTVLDQCAGCAWDVAGLAQHGVSEALKAEVSKAISGKPRGLQAADWPIVAAIAATFLIVATLPQNSTALADQVVAGHLRSLASYSWDSVLKPHPRAPDQPKTKIDVVYGEATGRARTQRPGGALHPVAGNRWPSTWRMNSPGRLRSRWKCRAAVSPTRGGTFRPASSRCATNWPPTSKNCIAPMRRAGREPEAKIQMRYSGWSK